ncbi:sigma-70 family RNA polymerase sigma factor [Marinilabiliaceae bacterium JC017]|nr:sigma-70 family RNA polymerase sigma factor [Marinilabiliaceae bacterium JC017]
MNKPKPESLSISYSLSDLFLAMAMKDDDRKAAEEAFAIIYGHYKNFLYTVIKKACSAWSMYGEELEKSVFQNTFTTIFLKADQFFELDELPPDKQVKRLKAWISKIACNEMQMLLRQLREEKEKMVCSDNLSFIGDTPTSDKAPDSTKIKLIKKALESLSEKDRDVLITYISYQDGNKKLPSAEIQRLSKIWKVHPDSLRQIRKRALDKVKKFVETYNTLGHDK